MPFAGRTKWGEVAGNVVLVLGGGLLAAAVFVAIPADVVAMRLLAWYTVAGVLLTCALVLALVGTRRLPALEPATLEGAPALAVRAWPVEWWYSNALDLGLGVLGVWLAVLGLRVGDDMVVPALLVGAPGVWFLARVGLALAGRRRNEALWLTDAEVVHDRAWGRERCRRTAVVRVRRWPGTGHRLLLEVDGAPDEQLCPRPWRTGRRVGQPGQVVVDCSLMGHDVDDLVGWLRGELALGDQARSRGPEVVRPPARAWPRLFLALGGAAGGVFSTVLGLALVLRAETLFGAVSATLFVLSGAIVLLSLVVRVTERRPRPLPLPRRVELDGEEADFHPRRTGWPTPVGYLVPGSLGVWAAAMAVVGAAEESWAWPLLFAVPAIYFLGFPVLWALGRFRPAGVWLTPTRVVNEHFGLRSELAVRDIATMSPWSSELTLMPHVGTPVDHRKLTPKWWRARLKEDRLVVNTEHLAGGSNGLAADVQRLLDARPGR